MTVGIDHNVEAVMSSIEDVQSDLDDELQKRVGAAMRVLWADARQYVLNDPNTTGSLFRSIKNDSDTTGMEMQWRVYTDPKLAAYAAVVEFGSGKRTNIPYKKGNNVPLGWPSESSSTPTGYPFDTASEQSVPIIAGHIQNWMMEKGVQPELGSIQASAWAIAATIVDRGQLAHPFLRPAWFDNELEIKRAAKNALRNAVR
jgi:hypothetical protein